MINAIQLKPIPMFPRLTEHLASTLAAVNGTGTACVSADNKQEGWCVRRAAGFDE